jgi:DNA repair/transcription protein MET18/MMS19
VKSTEKHTDIASGIDSIIPHFIKKAIEASIGARNRLILDPQVLETVALVIITIFTKVDSR